MDESECSSKILQNSVRPSKLFAMDSKNIDRIFSFLDAATLLEMRLADKLTKKTIESLKIWCEKLVTAYLPDLSGLLMSDDDCDSSTTMSSTGGLNQALELRNKSNPIWFRYFISILTISQKATAQDEFGLLMTALPRELLKTIQSTIG